MAGPALAYVYRYAHASELTTERGGAQLRLATCGGTEEVPHFFKGRLLQPRRTADLLRGLMQVVRARFHVPPAMLVRILAQADPVVTANDDRLRFEAFSACCSTYARVDLLPAATDGELHGRGTTNVDFNAPMLAALARIRDADTVALAVGNEAFQLDKGTETVVERKVALPLRWLKGFVEVQAYQRRLEQVHDISGPEAVRFVRSLPRVKTSCHPSWIVPAGRGLRLSQQAASNGVPVAGLERLRVLEDLAPHARSLRVYRDAHSQTSAWELVLDDARFHLVLSPDVWRGFSGEGQVLAQLAGDAWQDALPRVRASLRWASVIDVAMLSRQTRLGADALEAALSALGARGLVGYDLDTAAYFHRELPFDLAQVEQLQPRLQSARKLLAEDKVRPGSPDTEPVELFVAGSGVEHRVRLGADEARCTCPWFAKYQGQRGPCKHVLAAQLFLEESAGRADLR